MKKLILVLLLGAAFIIYINFDGFIEKVNDIKNPTFNISVENSLLGEDDVLTFDVLLKNVADNPISVGDLEITYIVILENKRSKKTSKDIEVNKVIDKKDQLYINVALSDYYNSDVDPEASIWTKNKKNSFGIKISVKNNSDKTIKWVKRKIAIST